MHNMFVCFIFFLVLCIYIYGFFSEINYYYYISDNRFFYRESQENQDPRVCVVSQDPPVCRAMMVYLDHEVNWYVLVLLVTSLSVHQSIEA